MEKEFYQTGAHAYRADAECAPHRVTSVARVEPANAEQALAAVAAADTERAPLFPEEE